MKAPQRIDAQRVHAAASPTGWLEVWTFDMVKAVKRFEAS
jgi:hypothetical protein